MKKILVLTIFCLFGLTSFKNKNDKSDLPKEISFKTFATSFYEHLKEQELNFKAFEHGLKGYLNLSEKKQIQNQQYLTIIDMSVSANKSRFFVIDVENQKVVHKSRVAHGRNSGGEFATQFSNKIGSYQSSLGFFKTAELYQGKHGLSLRLDGLESANSNARARAIVIHAADYVSESFINMNGRLGRSLGCPSLPEKGYHQIIQKIKEGSVLFVYYPEKNYPSSSSLIKADLNKLINSFLNG